MQCMALVCACGPDFWPFSRKNVREEKAFVFESPFNMLLFLFAVIVVWQCSFFLGGGGG